MSEHNDLLAGMVRAARAAGEIMLEADHIQESVDAKGGHANFVTKYDRRVQAELRRLLGNLLPEACFIGEEDGADQYPEAARRGYAFCVDPIDGTSNFLTGLRPSVTSIGLFHRGKPLLGVVYNPYADLMFSAEAGRGAHLNGAPLRGSESPLGRSLVGFGTCPYDPEYAQRTFAFCQKVLPLCIDLRRSGAAAWDLCSVAMGSLGAFFEWKLSLWDYAAGALIAQEAGCRVTDLHGGPLPWDKPSPVLCLSPGVVREATFPMPE